jgi:BlaI family transcriptional regulator, penicillinase repressor
MNPPVSDAEAQVMEVLWQQAPQAADDIARALAGTQGWQLSTVKTLLARLVQKGAVSAVPDKRRFLYSPLLQRQDWLGAQSVGLLDRLFGGQLAPLVAQFSAQRKLSMEDRAALEKLLREQGDE